MNIGAIIREKRRSKDMTQENLSEVLGVSVSAVSLWESGKTMPDIGLLPALCSVLAVSADELLGIDIDRKEEQINVIVEQSHKASDRGYTREGIEILEAGLKKYPDSYFIMSQLMDLNHSLAINEDDTQARSRAIELGETILEKCTDSGLRSSAVQILCFLYRENNPERAEKLLYSMDTMSTCQEVLATTTLTGEKKQEAQHHLIQQTLDLMTVSMGLYGYTDDRYTYNEWASVLEKIIAIYNIVYENGDFGFYHDRLMDAEKPLAIYYASKGDTEKTLEHLRKAADHAIAFVQFAEMEEMIHTSLVLRGRDNAGFSTDGKDNNAANVRDSMADTRYDFIRDTEEFRSILNDLNLYAGAWEKRA